MEWESEYEKMEEMYAQKEAAEAKRRDEEDQKRKAQKGVGHVHAFAYTR